MNMSMTGILLALLIIFAPPIFLIGGVWFLFKGLRARKSSFIGFGIAFLAASIIGFWLYVTKPWHHTSPKKDYDITKTIFETSIKFL